MTRKSHHMVDLSQNVPFSATFAPGDANFATPPGAALAKSAATR